MNEGSKIDSTEPTTGGGFFIRFIRWIIAVIIAGIVLVIGLSGAFGIFRKDPGPAEMVIGIIILLITFSIAGFLYRRIRGRKKISKRAPRSGVDSDATNDYWLDYDDSDSDTDYGDDGGGDFNSD